MDLLLKRLRFRPAPVQLGIFVALIAFGAWIGSRNEAGAQSNAPGSNLAIDSPSGVVSDGAGGVFFASRRKHQVYALSREGELRLVAGSGVRGYAGDRGPAAGAQLNAPTGLALDKAGNLYIADTGNSAIRKVTSDGTITTVAGTGKPGAGGDGGPAVSAKLSGPTGIAVSGSGELLIADFGNGRVRAVSPEGKIRTLAKGGGYAASVAVDEQNNVYTTIDSHQVARISRDGKTQVIAGTVVGGFNGDGNATSVRLGFPTGIAVDAMGNVYIADTNNFRVRKVTTTGVLETVAGSGAAGFDGDGGTATAAMMDMPQSIAVDADGNLFIADCGNHRIRKVSPQGIIDTLGGRHSPPPPIFPSAISIDGNRSISAVDAAGNIYIARDGRVRRLASNGLSTYVAGTRATGYNGDGGPATVAQMGKSLNLAVDAANNLYIADSQHRRVRKVGTDGVIRTIAGDGTSGARGDLGPAIAAQFSSFGGMAVDSNGNLYIAEPASHRVRRVTPTGLIGTVAGIGAVGYSGDGGPATAARVHWPEYIALDAEGNLYISATSQARVRKVGKDGKIVTVAGTGAPGFSGDGHAATAAKLRDPRGIAVDGGGNLYIADSGNFRIRKVTKDGIISTVAGSGTNGRVGDGGPALKASLSSLRELGIDAQGNLFAAEIGEGLRIRKVTPDGMIETVSTTSYPSSPIPISQPRPGYTQQARAARYQGLVLVTAIVDTKGQLEVLHVLGGPFGLADSATQTLQRWTFQPAVSDGTPVDAIIRIEVTFRLL